MSTNTYVALDKVTVGTATTAITFSSISSAYTDLVIAASFLPSVSTNQPYIQFNADTGTSTTNYSTTSLRGDGSSAASGRHTNQYGWFPVPGPGIGTNGNPEPWLINIMNYSNTTTYKTGLSRFNNAASIVAADVHTWRSTAAITSVTITMESGNFASGSTFSLYGIAAAGTSPAAKATGGAIYADDTYYYHVFGSTGTFTPLSSLTVDYLVVAGGGGGGKNGTTTGRAGGGGAGGFKSASSVSVLSSQVLTLTIGAGGTAGLSNANSGSNSTITGTSGWTTVTSTGGGGGGVGTNSPDYRNGAAGGSGGGAANYNGAGTAGAASPSGEGNAGGGALEAAPAYGAGGGGGAGAVGVTGTAIKAGDGGIGSYSTFTDAIGAATGLGQLVSSHYYFAGGGGGASYDNNASAGLGGLGGGGKGAFAQSPTNAVAGTANTGGGGGGATDAATQTQAGNGGSGIVIVRYLKA